MTCTDKAFCGSLAPCSCNTLSVTQITVALCIVCSTVLHCVTLHHVDYSF